LCFALIARSRSSGMNSVFPFMFRLPRPPNQEKTPVSVTSGRQFVRDSPGCIDMHKVKIYQARSRRFFGRFVAILPVCCRDRAERISVVRTNCRYVK
uniref:hypothetical protein n=1 Tax=Yersinia pestis TaxID=632 RepID=UPI0027DE8D44